MCGVMDWGGCVTNAANSALEAMAEAIADATAWIVVESLTWWIDTSSSGLNEGVVGRIRDVTWPLTISVAAAGMIVLGIKMAATGRADPLLSAGESIARLVFWTVSGVLVLNAFMSYAAAFSGWVLSEARTRELGARLSGAYGDHDIGLGAVLLLSLIGFLAGVVQWLIGLFREAGVVILAGCIPLAAAGNFLNQGWERRVVGWCLALIWWQPCAALVYFAAFAMLEEARGGQDILVGITMLLIAVAALPVLLKLFGWMTEQHGQGRLLGGGAGGGGALKGGATVAGARMSVTAMTRMVGAGLPPAGGGRGSGTSGTSGGGGGAVDGQPSGAASGQRTAKPSCATPRDTRRRGAGHSTPTGTVPGSRIGGGTSSGGPAGASPAGGGGVPVGTATAVSGTATGGGTATAGSGAGAAGAGTTAAAGAKGAALGGPVGAAAATAGAAAAAGARTAGEAMTEPPTGAADSGTNPGSKEGT